MLVIFTLGVAIVVGAVVALATGKWWALAIALLVHAVGSVIVLGVTRSALSQTEKPDPLTEAREEMGEDEDEDERGKDEPRMAI